MYVALPMFLPLHPARKADLKGRVYFRVPGLVGPPATATVVRSTEERERRDGTGAFVLRVVLVTGAFVSCSRRIRKPQTETV